MGGCDDCRHRSALDDFVRTKPNSSIICFGSFARKECKESSDLDVLVIEHGVRYHQSSFRFSDVVFDTTTATAPDIAERLQRTYPHNMNFLLNALTEGIVVQDHQRSASDLQWRALLQKARGPVLLKPSEWSDRRQTMIKLLTSCSKLATEASESKEVGHLAHFRLEQALMEGALSYFEVNALWSDSMTTNLSHLRRKAPVIYRLWMTGMGTSDLTVKLLYAERVVKAVFAPPLADDH